MVQAHLAERAGERDVDHPVELHRLGLVVGLAQGDAGVAPSLAGVAADEARVADVAEDAVVAFVGEVAAVEPIVVGAALVLDAQPVGLSGDERVGDEVADAHHLRDEVAVDVEDVVVLGAREEDVDVEEAVALGRQHLAELGDVAGVQVRTAVRHRAA